MAEIEDRVEEVEKAIVQINHFTEEVTKLDLVAWKSAVQTDLKWLKILLAIEVALAVRQALSG